MADHRDVFTEAFAELTADPDFVRFAGADNAVLVWDRTGQRLLWASAAAASLREALVKDEDGAMAPGLPALARLRALAAGLAPRTGFRLERLRFDPAHIAPPTTCACRRMLLPSGEEVLLTIIVGPRPTLKPGQRQARPEPPAKVVTELPERAGTEVAPEKDASPEPSSAAHGPSAHEQEPPLEVRDPVAHLRARGKVRFIWQADAEGRFTEASDLLAGIVGPERARIIGHRWDEIVGPDLEDPSGRVSEGFAKGETWSGETVFWRIRTTDFLIPVEFAGAPHVDRNGRLLGYRGFGLFRTGEIFERPRVEPAPTKDEEPGPESAGLAPDPEPPRTKEEGSQPEMAARESGSRDPVIESCRPSVPRPFRHLRGHARGRLGSSTSGLPGHRPDPRGTPAQVPEAPGETTRHPLRSDSADADHGSGRMTAPARLSLAERNAFREIARALGARFEGDEPREGRSGSETENRREEPARAATVTPIRPAAVSWDPTGAIVDRLPVGIVVHRAGQVVFANRHFLDLAGYDRIDELQGGIGGLFPGGFDPAPSSDPPSAPTLLTKDSGSLAVEVRLAEIEWHGMPATLVLVRQARETETRQRLLATELDLQARDARLRELSAILDTATDGVVILDDAGRILSLNRSAEALFGYEQNEVAGETFLVLLAPESHALARDYLEGLRANGVASVLNDGREVMGRVRQGGSIPLFMTLGYVSEEAERKFCAVLRDITPVKKAETELEIARRAAEEASAHKSDFLARVGHEIRSPLNAIVGFAEVMLEERFGPIGSERYKDYLRDIHMSGGQVVKLVNDLLDLAKIEAGRMELAFTGISLNERVAECVVELQAEAARRRIVVRTSFAPKLPAVVADERSIRQILANIVSNAIKFTNPGGQVIVSTAIADDGEVAMRIRDTGVGMTDDEVRAALGVFTQRLGTGQGGGTGLGLPLTKALVEANRGALSITSAPGEGTLVEVVFASSRVLAE